MSLSKYINHVNALQSFQMMRFTTLIIIGVLLVKFGYDKNEIGIYEMFFFWANVLTFFWTMGLKNALVSYYPNLDNDNQKKLLFNLAVLLLILGLVAGSLLFFFQDYIEHLLNKAKSIQYIHYIIFYLILSAPANFTEYYYLLRKKYKAIVNYGLVIFLLQLGLIALGLILNFEIKELLELMIVWASIKFIWFVVVLIKNNSFKIDFNLQKVFLFFAFPLILHMLLGNGMEFVDGFIVNYFYDEGVFAQFRYGARELPLVTILAGALSTAMIPIAVKNMELALDDIKLRVKNLMNILFPISIVLTLLSPIIFPLIYSIEFAISAQVFNVYLLIISSRLLMPQVILFAQHQRMVLTVSALVELIINIALSLYLLQHFGIVGIAWATVIAYMVNKVILMIYVKVKNGISLAKYLNLRLYSFWLLLLIISYYISTYYH